MKFMTIEEFNVWYQKEEHGGFQLAKHPPKSLAYMLYSIGWMSGYGEANTPNQPSGPSNNCAHEYSLPVASGYRRCRDCGEIF